MNIFEQISIYKRNHNMFTVDLSRQKQHLNQCFGKICSKKYKKYYKKIFDSFLSAGKSYQRDLRQNKTNNII